MYSRDIGTFGDFVLYNHNVNIVWDMLFYRGGVSRVRIWNIRVPTNDYWGSVEMLHELDK